MDNEMKECSECARKCENCEYFKEHFKKENSYSWGTWFAIVVVICLFLAVPCYILNESRTPKINVGGCELKIEEGSELDYLINSGLCTVEDIQYLIDGLLDQ